MKRFYTLLTCCLVTIAAFAQTPRLSLFTQKYLHAVKNNQQPQGYAYRKLTDDKLYISALLKVNDAGTAAGALKNIDALTGTKAGDIWTVQVPVERVEDFTTLPGIAFIELDQPVFPYLNQARKTTRVDSVHSGINLPMRYSGKGVVAGVIDFGFDYNHPTFYDTLHAVYRIKKVWELNTNGTPPTGYSYGHELADTIAIKAQETDNAEQVHGTATAGLAAGSGYGSTPQANRYRGMAYDADIVLVGVRRDTIGQQWLQGSFSDFIDGINYIFTYSDEVGKPAVVNISWGSQSGPHDGSTLFNQACNNLSGPGKIVVMSAGNEGEEKIHLSKTFTANDTVLNTFLTFSEETYKRTWIDTWGQPGKTFCANVTLYSNGVAGDSTGFFCLDNNIHDVNLLGVNGTDTCFVQFINSTSTFNGKPRMTIDIYNKAADSVGISLRSTDGTVHLWNEYYYYGYKYGYQSAFDSLNQSAARSGNTVSTVSDMGAADSVLLVGAYCSKSSFTDINGNNWSYSGYVTTNRLVPFSSRGPMADGRIKPDITAPGLTVATATNSMDTAYTPTGSNSTQVVKSWFDPELNKTFYYAEFTGTSASAPCAAGIVALMLQVEPTLGPQQVIDLIAETAIQDNYTGSIPAQGNNNWGHGKINAYQAIKLLAPVSGIYHYEGEKPDCTLYPNPTSGTSTLELYTEENKNVVVEIYDVKGNRISSKVWQVHSGENRYSVDLSGMNSGLYLVNVLSGEGFVSIKTVKE